MTHERKRAILAISATLIIGVLIGMLATGMFARHHYRGSRNGTGKEEKGRQGFAQKIYSITQADDSQKEKMKEIIESTTIGIDSLQHKTDREVKALLDSMMVNIKPILTSEQYDHLESFAKSRGDHDRHHKKYK
jgi:Spy/CpxP family protein refolding chaperone